MEDTSAPLVSRLALEVAFALLSMAFGATILAGALEFSVGWGEIGPEAGYFPFRIGVILILASLVNLVRALVRRGALAHPFLTRGQAGRLALFAVPVLGLVGVTLLVGIYVAAALYLLFSVGLAARHRLTVALGVSLGAPIILFVLFEIVFITPLLKGPLEALFGWY
ncbi:MAG: tripartite tricarboxylate transporter TctB family protein [Candidatus Methylomirabilales bacterium]